MSDDDGRKTCWACHGEGVRRRQGRLIDSKAPCGYCGGFGFAAPYRRPERQGEMTLMTGLFTGAAVGFALVGVAFLMIPT